MKGSFSILLILWSFVLFSQNLIPNPGFDIIAQCPFDPSQINFAPPWQSANNGTPDLFNECSTTSGIKVPYAGRFIDSYQLQRSGSGYASICVYSNGNVIGNECIETPLTEELIEGKNYYIEFFVSPDLSATTYWAYTDAIALALSDTFVYRELKPHEGMQLTPAIENPPIFITDTVLWTRISGCYQAKGGEKYAIIGNLKSTSKTRVQFEDPNSFPYSIYYFIEDVLVTSYDPLPDTILLCEGESIELSATFMDASYLWNTGDIDSILVVNSPGVYIVQTTINDCIFRDTVTILNGDEPLYFPNDTVLCNDEMLELTCPIMGSYLWSNGSSDRTIKILEGGFYSVSVTNRCGDYVFETNANFEACDCAIYIPNILSLNNDGINDELTLSISCDFDYHISGFYLFDRWGNNLYTATDDPYFVWDGKFQGELVQSGVYAWQMIYKIMRGSEKKQIIRTGNVTILR